MEVISTNWSVVSKNLLYIPMFVVGVGLSWDAIAILAVFMVADTFLGVLRSILLHGGNSFRSRLLAHGIVSKILVLFVPVLLVYTGIGIKIDFLPIAEGVITVLILSETYSILGHIQSVRTGKEVKEYDAVSMVLKSTRALLEKLLVNSKKR